MLSLSAMAESIHIDTGLTKSEQYEQLLPQIFALVEGEMDEVSVLANVAAALHHGLGHFWTGFYLVKKGELKLGPFQGPVACTSIDFGKGVCGSSWKQSEAIVVPDVDQFPGHIACSSASRSEIVVPIVSSAGEVVGVLDIDNTELNTFDDTDRKYLSELCDHLGKTIY